MKTISVTLVSLLAFLLSTGFVYAQDNEPEPQNKSRHAHQNKHHGMRRNAMAQQVFRMFKRLDLDETQQAELKVIFQALRTDLKPIVKEMKTGQMQLRQQVHSGIYDEEAIAAIAVKEGELTTDRLMLTSKAMSQAFNLLNDEQRAQLQSMAAERQARRGERRQKGKVAE